jgi:hypothetical protein
LDGRNVRSFLGEVASRLLRLLVDQVKRLSVTAAGGLRLMRDTSEYRDCVARFGSPAATKQYELLTDIAKIFLVTPENIKALVGDSSLGRLDPQELLEIVKSRADFKAWSSKWI